MEIVLLTTHPTSACAFYRSVGVLQQLRKLDPTINFRMSDSSNWASIGNADIVFLERPQDERFVKAIQDCKALGIPVWSDFDDDLFNLEKSNPGYSFYSQKKTQLAMAYSIANSDIVTVSTQLIADSFIQRFPEKLNLEVQTAKGLRVGELSKEIHFAQDDLQKCELELMQDMEALEKAELDLKNLKKQN